MDQSQKLKSPKGTDHFLYEKAKSDYYIKTEKKEPQKFKLTHKAHSLRFDNQVQTENEKNKYKTQKPTHQQNYYQKDHSFHDNSFISQKNVEEQDGKRYLIYDNQSYKQTGDQLNQTTVQSNNELFQMVFLNKPKLKESISTAASFSKNKTNQKPMSYLNIYQFSLGKKLGAGKFGQVFLARHIKTGFLCAIKRIDKTIIDHKLIIQLIRQIKIQTYLNHPNIVKMYTFFADERYIYLVLELCYSGQLYSYLKKKKKLSEDLTKLIIQQTLKALDYMHESQIIHRDLKPQNIIFHNGMIKLCDFGWSISSKTMRETFCGTPLYVSPQLLKRKNYNNKIDVWSVGILTYELLFGRVPFDITTQRDFIKIVQDQIRFSKATSISNQAKEFIIICLKKDPRDRYTVPQLLQHPFITSLQPVSTQDMY